MTNGVTAKLPSRASLLACGPIVNLVRRFVPLAAVALVEIEPNCLHKPFPRPVVGLFPYATQGSRFFPSLAKGYARVSSPLAESAAASFAASIASFAALLGFGDIAMAFCCSDGRSATLAASCTPIAPSYRLPQFRLGFLFDLARGVYHFAAYCTASSLC